MRRWDDEGWNARVSDHFLLPDELAAYRAALESGKRLPNGFWSDDEDGHARAAACLRYAVEVVCNTAERAAILHLANAAFLHEVRLVGMLRHLGGSIYGWFVAAFPEHGIQPWELHSVPRFYWQRHGEPAKLAAIRWWLNKQDMSAAQAADGLDRDEGIRKLLEQTGLATIVSEAGARVLLRKLDPGIPVECIPGRRKRKVVSREDRCVVCGCSSAGLATHAWREHGLSLAELRELDPNAPSESNEAKSRRLTTMAQRRANRRPLQHIFGREGLLLPRAWWPSRAAYATVERQTGDLLICPVEAGVEGARHLRLLEHQVMVFKQA